MATDKTWVDYWFIQATAWFLQLNIWIVATSSTDNSPYIQVSGNLGDGDMPCDGPIITLGTKSNVHYQSLLPLEMLHFDFNENQQDPDVQIQETRKNFNNIKNRENGIQNKTTDEPVEAGNLNTDDIDMDEIDYYLDKAGELVKAGNLKTDDIDIDEIDQNQNTPDEPVEAGNLNTDDINLDEIDQYLKIKENTWQD